MAFDHVSSSIDNYFVNDRTESFTTQIQQKDMSTKQFILKYN